jgi:hypothetical protein
MRHRARAALPGLRRRPGLAAAVVVPLTVCLGADAAIFSIVDAWLLRPLPYPAADRLVSLHEANLQRRQTEGLLAPVRASFPTSASYPRRFAAPDTTTELRTPMPPLTESRESRLLTAFGRLKPGVSAEEAQADLTAVQAAL